MVGQDEVETVKWQDKDFRGGGAATATLKQKQKKQKRPKKRKKPTSTKADSVEKTKPKMTKEDQPRASSQGVARQNEL